MSRRHCLVASNSLQRLCYRPGVRSYPQRRSMTQHGIGAADGRLVNNTARPGTARAWSRSRRGTNRQLYIFDSQ